VEVPVLEFQKPIAVLRRNLVKHGSVHWPNVIRAASPAQFAFRHRQDEFELMIKMLIGITPHGTISIMLDAGCDLAAG
jgi:hypothetical protein